MKSRILIIALIFACLMVMLPILAAADDSEGKGIDCSGLPFRAVNEVYGSKKYNPKTPIPEGANGQYLKFKPQKELKITRNADGSYNYDALQSMDLIYIDADNNGIVDHVFVYLGNGLVGESASGLKQVKSKDWTLEKALNRKLKDGKTSYDHYVGTGRIALLTKDQRDKAVKFIESLDGAKYQLGAKGYDTRKMEFATSNEIKNGYSWQWPKSSSETAKKRVEWIGDAKGLAGIDFSAIYFNYISVSRDDELGQFDYAMQLTRATEGGKAVINNIETALGNAVDSFFIGLALPNDRFWVNLNPWEPSRVVDEDVGTTDVGRIMLEADLQMKKDFCKYENPGESDIGLTYWELLDKKQQELVEQCITDYPGQIRNVDDVLFQAVTRHWIVPDEVTAYGDGDEIYIAKATLDIYSEPVYDHSTYRVVRQMVTSLSDEFRESLDKAAKEYGRYAMEVEEELLLPLVVEEVNNAEQYSELRQVYLSLALAQWYKEGFEDTSMFSDLINSKNLSGLESESPWSPRDIWEQYVKSYKEGEYTYEKKESREEGLLIITETTTYTGGGVDFGDIVNEVSIIGNIPQDMNDIFVDASYMPFVNVNGDYYFGDSLLAPVAESPAEKDSDILPSMEPKQDSYVLPPEKPEQDNFSCSLFKNKSKNSISGGCIMMVGIPFAIGVFKYFYKRRHF